VLNAKCFPKTMRIFIALDIPTEIRQRIERFVEGVYNFAPGARWVRPESLHVTLKFIGEKNSESVEQVKEALAPIKSSSFDLSFRGCGFFPTVKAARVFWIGIESKPELTALAQRVDEATAALGIAKEEHPFTPHLTLARSGRSSGAPNWQKADGPNRSFQKLQEKLAALPSPEFGTMTAREFFLYESRLMRGGSLYTKIAQFALSS
jgi:RNA 2',3'-cyclic 3'-phosphodiesterase